ncbi:MAG: hypothetical protein KF743_12310 [Fimbriimonadaceae bacterium]|nr:hypothetical protein [Fimbriimonadaceae bacterium]
MGWLSGWHTRAELVDHLTRDQRADHGDGRSTTWKVLKRAFRGNNLWTVIERADQFEGGAVDSVKFICLFMLQRAGDGTWAYKDVGASCGPTYYNCPTSWFHDVPVDGEYDSRWREACLESQSRRKRLRHGVRLEFDRDIRFSDGCTGRLFEAVMSGSRLYFKREDGGYVRLTQRLIDRGRVVD